MKAAFPRPSTREHEAASKFLCWLTVIACSAFLWAQGANFRAFVTMTDEAPYTWELTAFAYFLKVAQDNKEKVRDLYWAHAVVTVAIAAFGGGFLAPMFVCHCPVPLMEETFLWMVVLAWYITNHVPKVSGPLEILFSSVPGRVLFSVLFAIFKTQQIVGGIELADNAVRGEELEVSSRYFHTTPWAAPILCGFLSGCGGAFLPFDQGLKPIAQGGQWPVRSAFFAACGYYVATRPCGVSKLDAKMWATILRAFGEFFPIWRDRLVDPVTALLHWTLEVPKEPADQGSQP